MLRKMWRIQNLNINTIIFNDAISTNTFGVYIAVMKVILVWSGFKIFINVLFYLIFDFGGKSSTITSRR